MHVIISTTVKKLLFVFICAGLHLVDSGRVRQHYGARVLNIAPSACTSPKFPAVTGTCMISLECQQRSGTVIGACRDGLLFGACCLDANNVTTTTTKSTTDSLSLATEATSTSAKPEDVTLESQASTITVNISETEASIKEQTQVIHTDASGDTLQFEASSPLPSKITDKPVYYQTVAPSTQVELVAPNNVADKNVKASHLSTLKTLATVVTQDDVIDLPHSSTLGVVLDDRITNKNVQNVSKEQITTDYSTKATEGTTIRNELPSRSTEVSVEPTEQTTTPQTISSTNKFHYGKIKYSPKPMKPRSTTLKTVWTRPPTTEISYSIFTSSDESEEDEDDETHSKFQIKETTKMSTATTSLETSTLPHQQWQSTEEATTSVPFVPSDTEEVTTSPVVLNVTQEMPVLPIETPFTTEKVEKLVVEETINVTTTASTTTTEKPAPIKQSRNANAENEDDDSAYSNSSGWENKLDDFVNQVVEGIAGELDKSNIDDVVFKRTSTTAKPTTAAKTSTTLKPKKSTKISTKKRNKPRYKPKTSANKKPKVPSKITKVEKKTKPLKKVKPVKNADVENEILDYRTACGVRPLARNSRIVGGNPSTHGTWPWHALVKETVWWGIFSKVKCGGVLIGARHILTAAHCQPQQTGTLSVVLGVTDSDNPSSHAVTKGVRRVVRHPQFNPRTYENDIAILELESPVEFQPHIVPICLPNLKETFEGKEGYVTGMGLLKHDGERPLVLHEVDVPILNNTECQSMFRRSGNMKPIKPSFICAGYPQGLKDSCGGDSGGPLSVERPNGQWVLGGTVSHGIKCAVPNQPGVYMRTTWYLSWIEKVMRIASPTDSPKCHPPAICDKYPHQARSGGLMNTIFRIFRLARRLWKSRK